MPYRNVLECLRSFSDAHLLPSDSDGNALSHEDQVSGPSYASLPQGYAGLLELPSHCQGLSHEDQLLLASDYDSDPTTTDLCDNRLFSPPGRWAYPHDRRRFGPPICEMRCDYSHSTWDPTLRKYCLACQAWCDAEHAASEMHQTALNDYNNTPAGWARWSKSGWTWLSKFVGMQGR